MVRRVSRLRHIDLQVEQIVAYDGVFAGRFIVRDAEQRCVVGRTDDPISGDMLDGISLDGYMEASTL
jgi:hypothetical protein